MSSLAMNAYSTTSDLLDHAGYIFEPKLDGYRVLCYVNNGVKFITRNGLDVTANYPELAFRSSIKAKNCILDGEVIAYDKKGLPSFNALQNGSPATYMVFDILKKNDVWLIDKPLLERKKILETTVIDGRYIEKVFFTTQGLALWDTVVAKRMEGVMAKVKDSPYLTGVRSKNWLKIKVFNTIDCVIVGYKQGARIISSLALALYESDNSLRYIGNVGTGFSMAFLNQLYKQLEPLAVKKSPVNISINDMQWVKPRLVCEVKYVEITPAGMLRSPVFVRLRDDKKARDCTVKDQMLSFYKE